VIVKLEFRILNDCGDPPPLKKESPHHSENEETRFVSLNNKHAFAACHKTRPKRSSNVNISRLSVN